MKRAIIIPTFINHFDYIKDFLFTYEKNVYNSENISLNFILSNSIEKEMMEQIIKHYNVKNINCYSIIDILEKYNIKLDLSNILSELGKFSYQTIKKLYAIHYLKFDQSLIIDSESLICCKVNLNTLFDNYFKKPYVFYSNMPKEEEYKNKLDYKASISVAKLLNTEIDNCLYLEGFHWFYDIRIINDLFKYFNDDVFNAIYEYTKSKQEFDKAVFECLLYYKFIRINNDKYNYEFVNSKNMLIEKIKPEELNNIKKKMEQRNCKYLPFTIHGFEFGKTCNIKIWKEFLNKYQCQIIRLYPMRKRNKRYIIKKMIYDFNTKIICATDDVWMYKKIAVKKNFSFFPLLINEWCNQW